MYGYGYVYMYMFIIQNFAKLTNKIWDMQIYKLLTKTFPTILMYDFIYTSCAQVHELPQGH